MAQAVAEDRRLGALEQRVRQQIERGSEKARKVLGEEATNAS